MFCCDEEKIHNIMRVLVTGAAGFIGSQLAERLTSDGHDVTGIDNMLNNYSARLKQSNINSMVESGCEFLVCDLANDSLKPIIKDVDIIYHCAAQPGLSDTANLDDFIINNCVATDKLVQATISCSSFKGSIIYISTSSVYGPEAVGAESSETRPSSYYGITKLASEHLVMTACRQSQIKACALRLFSVYGPRERPEKLYPKLIASILNKSEFSLYEGSENHFRSYTYIDDVLDGMILTLNNIDKCNGEVINIGSDISITTGEGINIVESILGSKAHIKKLPKRSGDQLETRADIKKAKKLLGYQPKTSVKDGLIKEIEWYQNSMLDISMQQ